MVEVVVWAGSRVGKVKRLVPEHPVACLELEVVDPLDI